MSAVARWTQRLQGTAKAWKFHRCNCLVKLVCHHWLLNPFKELAWLEALHLTARSSFLDGGVIRWTLAELEHLVSFCCSQTYGSRGFLGCFISACEVARANAVLPWGGWLEWHPRNFGRGLSGQELGGLGGMVWLLRAGLILLNNFLLSHGLSLASCSEFDI